MHDLMKPIIFGALIVAIGIFVGAQRIAYEMSFEGRWESCVKTFNNEATQKAIGLTGMPVGWAQQMCFRKIISTNN
jgi:hypothetical protein